MFIQWNSWWGTKESLLRRNPTVLWAWSGRSRHTLNMRKKKTQKSIVFHQLVLYIPQSTSTTTSSSVAMTSHQGPSTVIALHCERYLEYCYFTTTITINCCYFTRRNNYCCTWPNCCCFTWRNICDRPKSRDIILHSLASKSREMTSLDAQRVVCWA